MEGCLDWNDFSVWVKSLAEGDGTYHKEGGEKGMRLETGFASTLELHTAEPKYSPKNSQNIFPSGGPRAYTNATFTFIWYFFSSFKILSLSAQQIQDKVFPCSFLF